jgi:hypothetical protein
MNDAKTAKAFADLEKAEGKLLRAFNKWVKCKAKVKRMDAKYAKALEASVPLPGKMDVRQMPIEPKPWPKKPNRVIKVKLKNR